MYKAILIIFLAVFTANLVNAQSVLSPALSDTLSPADIESRDQLIYLADTEELATGIIEEYYESGQIKIRHSVVSGKVEGLWVEWFETGIPRYIAEWKQGKGHGQWIYFHENGQISARETVRDDIWHGISESWYANGQKKSEGHHQEGSKHGVWKQWASDGSLEQIEEFIDGTLIRSYTE